jgi:hypothetical protein
VTRASPGRGGKQGEITCRIEGEEIDCRALPEALNSDRAGPGDGVSGRDDEGSVASVNHGAGPEAVDEATA